MAEKTEFLTILNLFKSNEPLTLKIAYVLLKNRLDKIDSLTFDRYFMIDLMGYLKTADHVPGIVHADIYNILTKIIMEDKANITNVANRANSLLNEEVKLKNKIAQLEKEKDILVYSSFIKHAVCEALDSDHTVNPSEFISLDKFFDKYCEWHQNNFKMAGYSYPKDKETFKKMVEQTWSQKAIDNKWFGLRFK